jgi:hypothetical protein
MPLGALGPIEIQLVRRTADEPLFHSLMEQFHYLRYEQPVDPATFCCTSLTV